MSDETPKAPPAHELQFNEAEFAAPNAGEPTCSACHQTIPDHYFQANGAILCERCSITDTEPDDDLAGEKALSPSDFFLGIAFLLAFMLALPIIAGLSQPIGLLIVAFALWEAFKLNRKVELVFSGPHSVGRPPDQAPAHA